MNNKKNKLFQIAVMFIVIPIIGCVHIDWKDVNCQFTPDELSHLYFDRDSLVYDGHSINYYDTISFLQNTNDTIFVRVHTSINSFTDPYDTSTKSLYGYSILYLDEQTWGSTPSVTVIKDNPNTGAEIKLDLCLINAQYAHVTLDFPLDTALVLGKTYSNVYKIEYPENSPTKLKKIFFAKKFGVIKIEAADGRKIEKLDLSKEEIRTIISNENKLIDR